MPSTTEIRTQITNQIIESLQNGISPWRRPWSSDKNCGRPCNAVSKRPYNGINILQTALHNHRFSLRSRYFATYRQWEALGGQVMRRPAGVRSGQWGCKAILWKPVTKTTSGADDETTSFCIMKQFTLFSIDQVEGEHLNHLRVGYTDNEHDPDVSIQHADELIANTQAHILHGGNRACFDQARDLIQMPHKHQFDGTAYYETLFHELVHHSEAPARMNVDRSDETNAYALGELVAEMGSCFVCSELGIALAEGIGNHAAYVGSWLKALADDQSFIFKASSQASKVCDYLLTFQPSPVETPEPAVFV